MYAVYQIGGPVYGIGATPAEAAAQAYGEAPPEGSAILSCRPCSAALAAEVERYGGEVRYVVRDGLLCLAFEV